MSQADRVREEVSIAYAHRAKGHGCGAAGPKEGQAVYRPEEIANLPAEAIETSFGCGNPLAFSQVRPGDTVLDLGSGAGLDLLVAARKVGPTGRVIGVDMTDVMIEKARRNIEASGLKNVEVRKGIIENLPVESGSVDWVISNCVVNLSPEKPRVFAEIARVLKPGGGMLISDILVNDPPAWVRTLAQFYAPSVAGALGEREYVPAIEAAGLADVKIVDRFVYDAATLRELVKDEIAELGAAGSCAGGGCSLAQGLRAGASGVVGLVLPRIVAAVEGKVTSIRVSARKPATPAAGAGPAAPREK